MARGNLARMTGETRDPEERQQMEHEAGRGDRRHAAEDRKHTKDDRDAARADRDALTEGIERLQGTHADSDS